MLYTQAFYKQPGDLPKGVGHLQLARHGCSSTVSLFGRMRTNHWMAANCSTALTRVCSPSWKVEDLFLVLKVR